MRRLYIAAAFLREHAMPIAITCVLFACAIPLLAQDDTTTLDDDSLSVGRRGIRIGFGVLIPDRLSTLSFSAGYASPSIDDSPRLSPATVLELDFGTLSARQIRGHAAVYRLEQTSIAVAALSPSLNFRDESRVAVEGWRFGFRIASGHRFAPNQQSGLYLLHAGGWTWSYVQPGVAPHRGDSLSNAQATTAVEGYRTSHFGANTSATIGYSIAGILTLEVRYQRVLLYKNHVFFPWLGSIMIEGFAQSLLGVSLQAAEKRNPHAAAIATLILRSALSWGIYELRRTTGQHFPFKGNTPMLWDEGSIGISIPF